MPVYKNECSCVQVDQVTGSVFADVTFQEEGTFVKESFMKYFELRDTVVHADEVPPHNPSTELRNVVCVGCSQGLDCGQR